MPETTPIHQDGLVEAVETKEGGAHGLLSSNLRNKLGIVTLFVGAAAGAASGQTVLTPEQRQALIQQIGPFAQLEMTPEEYREAVEKNKAQARSQITTVDVNAPSSPKQLVEVAGLDPKVTTGMGGGGDKTPAPSGGSLFATTGGSTTITPPVDGKGLTSGSGSDKLASLGTNPTSLVPNSEGMGDRPKFDTRVEGGADKELHPDVQILKENIDGLIKKYERSGSVLSVLMALRDNIGGVNKAYERSWNSYKVGLITHIDTQMMTVRVGSDEYLALKGFRERINRLEDYSSELFTISGKLNEDPVLTKLSKFIDPKPAFYEDQVFSGINGFIEGKQSDLSRLDTEREEMVKRMKGKPLTGLKATELLGKIRAYDDLLGDLMMLTGRKLETKKTNASVEIHGKNVLKNSDFRDGLEGWRIAHFSPNQVKVDKRKGIVSLARERSDKVSYGFLEQKIRLGVGSYLVRVPLISESVPGIAGVSAIFGDKKNTGEKIGGNFEFSFTVTEDNTDIVFGMFVSMQSLPTNFKDGVVAEFGEPKIVKSK